jgi:predicted dehydrogenase
MNHRYRADVQLVRSFVQTGELGEVESVRGSWHVFRPSRAMLGWRTKRDLSGGGAMLDLGLSILDLALWLAGNPTPTRVSATLDRPGRERATEQAGSAFVVCEGGASLFVDVTWHHLGEGERFGVGLRGSKGTASINPLTVWKELNGMPVDVAPTGSGAREIPSRLPRAEWAHFSPIRAKSPSPPADHSLHRIVDAIPRRPTTAATSSCDPGPRRRAGTGRPGLAPAGAGPPATETTPVAFIITVARGRPGSGSTQHDLAARSSRARHRL